MTAEIVLMNKRAVALAADSAATVTKTNPKTGSSEKKVFKGANKVFALTKHAPIGVMIFGSADFMGVPWETLIRLYRKHIGKSVCHHVKDYADDFFRFLQSRTDLFPQERQKSTLLYEVARFIYFNIFSALNDAVENKNITRQDKKLSELGRVIDKLLIDISSYDYVDGFDKNMHKEILKKYHTEFEDHIKQFFSGYALSNRRKDKLKQLFSCVVCKEWFEHGDSGIVFTGFGEDDYFPSLVSYGCRGVIENVVLRNAKESVDITFDNISEIKPFAQTEMVNTFINGIDPGYLDVISAFIGEAIKDVVSEVRKHNAALAKTVKLRADEIKNSFYRNFAEYIQSNHSGPIYDIVDVLPMDELAELAETLIIIESLKKRITEPIESVAGPVDVAVITKSEGLVWIKRKHYFTKEINEQYFLKEADNMSAVVVKP